MKSSIAVLAAAFAVASPGPALAGTAVKATSLLVGGRTIAGPADSTFDASVTEAVASQLPSIAACATVANTGTGTVDLTVIGGGSASIQVPVRKTLSLCRAGLQTVNITCLAAGSGSCTVSWRVDAAE